ncbi:hypothetical protein [Gallaecimonas pentaromativorans]|uniref:hypothetical protein n=1 Tax=Gallaecimonas pentaromativorans TaxID=584787 RepID=UPI003A95B0ED
MREHVNFIYIIAQRKGRQVKNSPISSPVLKSTCAPKTDPYNAASSPRESAVKDLKAELKKALTDKDK